MNKILSIFAVAVLSLFAGKAFAQRNLPGMSAVEVRADMVNGFYTGNSRNCGYNIGVFYSVIKDNNANTWSFGGEYLQTYKPYGEKGRIPVAQFTGEVGYNLHIVSDYSQTFHLYGGALTLSADFYLSDRIILTANVKERFVFGNSTGHFHTQYGIGIKFRL